MSNQKTEDIMNNVLSGDVLKNALDFAAFLKENELTVNEAEISYQGKAVCYMHLDGGEDYPSPWTIWTEGDYSCERKDIPVSEPLKEIAWANVNICGSCGGICAPGTRKTIFGKDFDNVCNADMAFYKPDAEALECVKKLVEIRKNDILNGA